jgi:ubiquinone/menaquinone biosynthesis C-methylase UbiE
MQGRQDGQDRPDDLEAQVRTYVHGWMTWRRDREQWIEHKVNAEHYQHGYIQLLDRYTEATPGPLLLDLGCGLGGFSTAAARRGAHVVPLDPNPEHLVITRLRLARYGICSSPLCQSTGEVLPFADRAFDIVTAFQVLEHVIDPDQVLTEMFRVLRPGGVAFVTYLRRRMLVEPHYQLPLLTWMPLPLARLTIRLTGHRIERQPTGQLEIAFMHYFHRREFVQRIEAAGFTDHVFPDEAQLDLVRHPIKQAVVKISRKMGVSNWLIKALRLRTSSQLCLLFKAR